MSLPVEEASRTESDDERMRSTSDVHEASALVVSQNSHTLEPVVETHEGMSLESASICMETRNSIARCAQGVTRWWLSV